MANKQAVKESYSEQVNKLAAKLGIDYAGTLDVIYFRSRKRWTKALEKELIELHKKGTPPNMDTFGTATGVVERVFIPKTKPSQKHQNIFCKNSS